MRDIDASALQEIAKYPSMRGLSVHCIGPMFPQEAKTDKKHFDAERRISAWLDEQEAYSVVYVSFGSVASPTKEQIPVIGQALLALGKPFIWSSKEKHHEHLPKELRSQISRQFDDNTVKFLVLPWAPQKLILAHQSTAVYLSHCGWNSTLEGLSSGTPFVAWPMFGDQLLNAQWIEDLGAGVLIPETSEKGARPNCPS